MVALQSLWAAPGDLAAMTRAGLLAVVACVAAVTISPCLAQFGPAAEPHPSGLNIRVPVRLTLHTLRSSGPFRNAARAARVARRQLTTLVRTPASWSRANCR